MLTASATFNFFLWLWSISLLGVALFFSLLLILGILVSTPGAVFVSTSTTASCRLTHFSATCTVRSASAAACCMPAGGGNTTRAQQPGYTESSQDFFQVFLHTSLLVD